MTNLSPPYFHSRTSSLPDTNTQAPADAKDKHKLQYCHRCEAYKPPRAHHCRICDAYVLFGGESPR